MFRPCLSNWEEMGAGITSFKRWGSWWMTVKGGPFTQCDTVTTFIQSRAVAGLETGSPGAGIDGPRGG